MQIVLFQAIQLSMSTEFNCQKHFYFNLITILYRNTKVKVRSPDGDTEYIDIVAGVLQGDTLAPYLFIICLDYVLRASIDKIRENGFELKKKRSQKTYEQHYYLSTLPRLLIPFTEGRWNNSY